MVFALWKAVCHNNIVFLQKDHESFKKEILNLTFQFSISFFNNDYSRLNIVTVKIFKSKVKTMITLPQQFAEKK